MVVLPQFGDQLSSLQLDLRVGGQVVGGRMLSDHSIGLDIQIPVDTENKVIWTELVKNIKNASDLKTSQRKTTLKQI